MPRHSQSSLRHSRPIHPVIPAKAGIQNAADAMGSPPFAGTTNIKTAASAKCQRILEGISAAPHLNPELHAAEQHAPIPVFVGHSNPASAVNDDWDERIGSAAHAKSGRVSYLVRARLQLGDRRPEISNAGFHLQNEPVTARIVRVYADVVRLGFGRRKRLARIAVDAYAARPRQTQRNALTGAVSDEASGVRVAMKPTKLV